MLALGWLSCATVPAAGPTGGPAASPVPPAAPAGATPVGSVICHPHANQVLFSELGVPEGERAVAVAIAEPDVYVLFAPARLVRLRRGENGALQSEMRIVHGETWKAMDVDPRDGSLWVASDRFVLRHFTAGGGAAAVPLQRVAGDDGFHSLLVAADAIYAVPACAQDGVWRIDRQGKVLSSAFPYDPAGDTSPDKLTCGGALLMRDDQGRVLARDAHGAVHQVDSQGVWREVAGSPFGGSGDGGTVLRGVDVGEKSERWYFGGRGSQLFYWKGRPVFLGGSTLGGRVSRAGQQRADTVLVLPTAGGARDLLEDCQGHALRGIATTATRYAAITGRGLIYGDLASAPDLP